LSRLFARGDNVGRVVAVAAVLAVVFSVGLDVATLTRAPEPYGDEAWVGSAVWSFTHGHGLRPAIAVGSGIYDGTFDHWIPRVGILPQIVAQLVAGTSFTAYRAGSLVVSLFGLGVLALGLRRRYGTSVAALAAAAAATTWIYFAASHYIRWDDVTFLWASTIFTLLVIGPPSPRRALAIGLLIGISPDFSVPTLALLPAAIACTAWGGRLRSRPTAALVAGFAIGLAAYVGMHFFPDIAAARRQYRLVYGSAYKLPILQALEQRSLAPIWAERERYRLMGLAPFRASRLFLGAAVVAAVVALAALARRGREYPWTAVGSALLISQLVGLALLYANRAPAYAIGALPFAAAALVEGLSVWPRFRTIAPAVGLMIATALGGLALVNGIEQSDRGAATNGRVSELARSLVRPGQVAVGDYVYWWLFPRRQLPVQRDHLGGRVRASRQLRDSLRPGLPCGRDL
jgi:hypothetical protein